MPGGLNRQTISSSFSKSGGQVFPLGSRINVQVPVFTRAAQAGGYFSTTANLAVPAIAAGGTVDVSVLVPITTFPTPVVTSSALDAGVNVSVFLAQLPVFPSMASSPFVGLTFQRGSAASISSGTTTSNFSLQPGQNYQTPTLKVTVRFFSSKATPAQIVPIIVQAVLYATPA